MKLVYTNLSCLSRGKLKFIEINVPFFLFQLYTPPILISLYQTSNPFRTEIPFSDTHPNGSSTHVLHFVKINGTPHSHHQSNENAVCHFSILYCPISAAGPTAGSCAGPCPGPMSLPGPAGTIVVLDSAGSSTVSAVVSGTTAGAEYRFPAVPVL